MERMVSYRTGHGIDVHPFDATRPMVLGGVNIADTGGLSGHSDADALLHAITDALLGATGSGDIGEYFPSSDPRWKGASSRLFVEEALRLVRERHFGIENIDITVVAERPRLAPHRVAIRASVAEILGIESDRVNVKATTTDGLGFLGRSEGVAVFATVMIRSVE